MSKLNKYPLGGFTLIELLVVVLIIGILAAIALPQYQHVVDKTRYAALMDITKAIADANERFYLVHDRYSTNFAELDVDIPANDIYANHAYFDWGNCTLVGQQETQCYNETTLRNQFVIYYHNSSYIAGRSRTLCTAITTVENSRYDKICQGFGVLHQTACECIGGTCRTYWVN